MFNRHGNNNGHHRNGTGNGLVLANSLPRTGYGGNGQKPDAALVMRRPTSCSGTGSRPPSRRRSDSHSTRPSSRNARAAPVAPTTTSKATSLSRRPTISSLAEVGDTTPWGT